MKYLCMVYLEEAKMGALTRRELDVIDAESMAYDEELRRSGHYVAAEALQPVSAATCVRVRNDRASTTDGPFAETKEHLGGFILVEARDLNDAIRLASRIPLARTGTVEVRPVMDFSARVDRAATVDAPRADG
jgi:hypothetical protein